MSLCDFKETQGGDGRSPVPDLPEGVPPLRAFYLYLTNSCNLRCRHCWITPKFEDGAPGAGEAVPVELLRDAVREAGPLGLSRAKLTGGEPLLHPGLVEIVDLLTAEGLHMDMETNGTLLTAELARHFKEKTNLGFISISLDGVDAATHDRFRGVPGAYDAALKGLAHLRDAGYTNTQIIMSVHRGNLGHLEALLALAVERGAGSVKLNPVTRVGRGAAMHERGEGLGFDERLALAVRVREDLRGRFPIPIIYNLPPALRPIRELWENRGRTGDCGVRHVLGILGTGEMALCGIGRTIPELVYGRLGRESIREVWLNHPTVLELRRLLDDVRSFPGVCGRCTHARSCRTGCVALNYVDGRRLVWPDPLCEESERRGIFPTSRKRDADTRREGDLAGFWPEGSACNVQ